MRWKRRSTRGSRPRKRGSNSRSLLGRRALLGVLAALLPGLLDDLGQAAGVARRADRRAAVDSGRADRLDRLRPDRPRFTRLLRAGLAITLWDAEALAFRTAGADHDLVVGRARAWIVAVND